jgi:hypothetical protein
MEIIANRFEDLGDVTELYHHNIRNVSAYLLSCGFEKDTRVNYKWVRIFIDKKNNRSVKVHLDQHEERNDIVERIEFLKQNAKGI